MRKFIPAFLLVLLIATVSSAETVRSYNVSMTASGSTALFTTFVITKFDMCITGTNIVFGSPAPNAVIVDLQTSEGKSLDGFPLPSMAAGDFIEQDPIVCYKGTLRVVVTGNTTNSAVLNTEIQGL